MAERARLGAALLAALAIAAPARADCFDWADAGAILEQGVLHGLPPGPVHWRTGRLPFGGVHMLSAVELRWTAADGTERRQTLFDEIQDGRPRLSVAGNRLRLRIAYCATGGPCRNVTLPYAWNRATGRFAGATPAAREALADACAPGPGP